MHTNQWQSTILVCSKTSTLPAFLPCLLFHLWWLPIPSYNYFLWWLPLLSHNSLSICDDYPFSPSIPFLSVTISPSLPQFPFYPWQVTLVTLLNSNLSVWDGYPFFFYNNLFFCDLCLSYITITCLSVTPSPAGSPQGWSLLPGEQKRAPSALFLV